MRNAVAFAIPDVRWPEEPDEAFSDVLQVTRAAWFTEIVCRIDWPD